MALAAALQGKRTTHILICEVEQVKERGVLGWERRGGSAAEKGEFWASSWADSRGRS
jgi:hypothetical protein